MLALTDLPADAITTIAGFCQSSAFMLPCVGSRALRDAATRAVRADVYTKDLGAPCFMISSPSWTLQEHETNQEIGTAIVEAVSRMTCLQELAIRDRISLPHSGLPLWRCLVGLSSLESLRLDGVDIPDGHERIGWLPIGLRRLELVGCKMDSCFFDALSLCPLESLALLNLDMCHANVIPVGTSARWASLTSLESLSIEMFIPVNGTLEDAVGPLLRKPSLLHLNMGIYSPRTLEDMDWGFLSATRGLQTLCVRYSRLNDEHARGFFQSLPPGLTRLDLRNNRIGPWEVAELVKGIAGRPLKALDLSLNDLTNECALQVAALCASMPSLESINLGQNAVSRLGVEAIVQQLGRATSLTSLLLRDCEICNEVAGGCLRGVLRSMGRLRELCLGGNALVFGTELPIEIPQTVRRLDVSESLILPEGAVALANALPRFLTSLDLSETGLGDQGTIALAGAGLPPNLRNLEMQGDEIGYKGAAALAKALPGALERLDVSYNRMSLRALEVLAAGCPSTVSFLDTRSQSRTCSTAEDGDGDNRPDPSAVWRSLRSLLPLGCKVECE